MCSPQREGLGHLQPSRVALPQGASEAGLWLTVPSPLPMPYPVGGLS